MSDQNERTVDRMDPESPKTPANRPAPLYMGRRRGQRKGWLRQRGPSWIGSWREDVRDEEGNLVRVRMSRVIAPAKGRGKKTKREAQRIFWEEILSHLDTVSLCSGSLTTLRNFVSLEFERNVVSRTRSPHYRTTLKHVLEEFGDRRLRDIQPRDVQHWVSAKIKSGLVPQTVKHLVGTIRAIFKHAKAMGYYVGDLPTDFVRLPPPQRKRRGALSPEQVRAIAERLPAVYRVLVLLLACTGLRIGEALGLRWGRINVGDEPIYIDGEAVPGRSLLVREAWVRSRWTGLKTEGSEGAIPIADRLLDELVLLKSRTRWDGPADPVFAVKDRKPLSPGQAARKYLKPALRDLGLPETVSWHWFRHTLSTLGDQIGRLTEAERQKILRHAAAGMTRHYTHADLERAREGLNAVAEAVFGARKSREAGLETDWVN